MPTWFLRCHTPRASRGGGVAIFYRSSLKLSESSSSPSPPSTFEYMSVFLGVNHVSLRLIVVYRPPKQNISLYIEEFSSLIETMNSLSGKLLVIGDFNIHLDDSSNRSAQQFVSVIDAFGLAQDVSSRTHINGHTLDMVLCGPGDKLVSTCYVSDLLSDHFSVISTVRAHRPFLPTRSISFRAISATVILILSGLIYKTLHLSLTLVILYLVWSNSSPLVCNWHSTIMLPLSKRRQP